MAVDLFWLPLGAGGRVVAFNGRCYERMVARWQHRSPADLYHAALTLETASARYVIELAPALAMRGQPHGAVASGPVGWRGAGRWAALRYEVRAWQGGVIPDVEYAVDSPIRVSADPAVAAVLLCAAPQAPTLTWGRDERSTGDMWNSNSLVSWLLEQGGIDADADAIAVPAGGRAPGWQAGIAVARSGQTLS